MGFDTVLGALLTFLGLSKRVRGNGKIEKFGYRAESGRFDPKTLTPCVQVTLYFKCIFFARKAVSARRNQGKDIVKRRCGRIVRFKVKIRERKDGEKRFCGGPLLENERLRTQGRRQKNTGCPPQGAKKLAA